MPGKYSHSVVLADYSSRGLMILPFDQQTQYASLTPIAKKPVGSSTRLRGTRSAQAIYQLQSTSTKSCDSLTNRPHPHLSTNTTRARARVNVPAKDVTDDPRSKRISQYHDQLPRSTPAVNVVESSELRTAYARQQQRNIIANDLSRVSSKLDQQTSRSVPLTDSLTLAEALIDPVLRDFGSDTSLREETAAASSVSKEVVENTLSSQSSSSETLAQVLNRARKKYMPIEDSKGFTAESKTKPGSVAFARAALMDGRKAVAHQAIEVLGNRDGMHHRRVSRETITQPPTSTQHSLVERSNSNESGYSRRKQIWNPTPLREPVFDGFTDYDEGFSGCFEVPKQNFLHSRDSSANSMLLIQRPEPPDGPKVQGPANSSVASPQAPHAHAESDTPSRFTTTSHSDLALGHRSEGSASSVSMLNNNVVTSIPSKWQESSVSPVFDQKWGLPDIREDQGFSPSIFEDKEGEVNKFELEDFDIGTSIGHISSGKIVLDDNDAASAALPPPITRFKDEEEEFNANMTKLFSEGNDYAAKNGSVNLGRRGPAKKSRGIFSTFRSKN